MRPPLALRPRCALTAVALLVLAAATARAQRTVTVSMVGGASIPTGELREAAGLGYHGALGVGVQRATWPFSVTAEGGYHRFGEERDADRLVSGRVSVLVGTVNAKLNGPRGSGGTLPYLTVGVGIYNSGVTGSTAERSTRAGVNAGIGAQIVRESFSPYAEARFHYATWAGSGGAITFLPISFGFRF
jgi:hypothetical protein